MSKSIKISDFTQDDRNFNRHTEAGMELLKKSIETVGVIEAVTVSSDDKIITGNARQENFCEVLGDAEPIVVDIDGSRPVVLRRTDIQSGTKRYHEAALLANTTAKKNISLDIELIQDIAVEEFDIDIVELGVEIMDFDVFPPEIRNSDLTPDMLPKIEGDDNTLMQRVIITYPLERQPEIERILGVNITKVIYNINEIIR